MLVHMETTPGEIVDIGGMMAKPIRSMFQTDSAGLRFILPATWALRSPQAIVWVEGATW
jgi:hypothetical protein